MKLNKLNFIYIILSFICCSNSWGQGESFEKMESLDSLQTISLKDTAAVSSNSIFPFPILFYTPETGVAGGAMALYVMREPEINPKDRPSNISGDIIYTAKKQVIIELNSDIYFNNSTYHLLLNAAFKNFPDKFYGIGNNTLSEDEEGYTSKTFFLKTTLSQNIYSRMNIGTFFRIESTSIPKKEPGGYLASGIIPGTDGGIVSGIGFLLSWDSRDNIFSSYSGSFYQLTALFNAEAFGGNFNYTDITLDARNFFELFPSQILAVQGLVKIIDGTAPFQNLVSFGGQDVIRGYTYGQYRDNSGAAIQAEYRFPVFWRIGAVVFGGFGQVASNLSNLKINEFKSAAGAGFRFLLDPKERVFLRLDFGYGQNCSGMYISAGQAF